MPIFTGSYAELKRQAFEAVDRAERARRGLTNRDRALIQHVSALSLQQTPATPAASPSVQVHDNALHKPFVNLGRQLLAIRAAALTPYQTDLRLHEINRRGTAAGSSEAVPADGGFLLQPEFVPQLIQRMYATGEILSRCTEFPVTNPSSNGLALPAFNETSRANGSRFGGVEAYWEDEAEALNPSHPTFGRLELTARKLTGLCYATDEMLADSDALGLFIELAFGQEMSFRLEDAIINGRAGQVAGIMNTPAMIKVPKEVGQASGTIVTQNIVKAWGRLWAPSRRSAVWIVNAEAEEQLLTLTLAVGSGGSEIPLYKPTEDPENQPYNLMLGMPVITAEYCQLPGTPGDVIGADLSRYVLAWKERLNAAMSIHARFLTEEQAFRFTMRVDGAPIDMAQITPMNGTVTQSPFVCIDQR